MEYYFINYKKKSRRRKIKNILIKFEFLFKNISYIQKNNKKITMS